MGDLEIQKDSAVQTTTPGQAISQAKLEANRVNAQLSTGPKTTEGKRASKFNAVTHGISAQAIVVKESESIEEYQQLLSDLFDDRQPVGALEERLVERIAVLTWKFWRLTRCETDAIQGESEAAKTGRVVLPREEVIDKYLRYATGLDRQHARAISQLDMLQKHRKGSQLLAEKASGDADL